MRAGLLQIKDKEVPMRLSRVFLSRALLLCIAAFSAFSLYLVALPFMMLTGENEAPHLGQPAVANTEDEYWRSILGLGSLLNTVDQQLSESAEELRSIQRSMTHLSTNYALHGSWAPLSPAEYVFPLHSSAVLLHILPYPHLLKCSDIEQLSDSGPAGVTHPVAQLRKLSSPTKDYISQSTSVGHPFALFCHSQNGNVDNGSEECYQNLNHKLMVEGIFRQELEHYMIAKLAGYCVKETPYAPFGTPGAVTLLTEYSAPLYIKEIVIKPFKTRLSLAVSLAHLLVHLSDSKYGSLRLHNLTYDSFVVIDQHVKLFDLSGLDSLQPLCTKQEDCMYHGILLVHCNERRGLCLDWNARVNLFNFNQLFFQKLLQNTDDVPLDLEYRVVKIRKGLTQLKYSTKELFLQLKEVLDILAPTPQPPMAMSSHQSNVASHKYNYKMVQDADLKGRYDYICPHTHAAWGCVHPVYTLDSAKTLCDTDNSCKSFVVIHHTNRKGWYIAFYKNGVGRPDTHMGATLFIKLDGSGGDGMISHLNAEEEEGEGWQQFPVEREGGWVKGEKSGTESVIVSPHMEEKEEGGMNKEVSVVNSVDEPSLREEAEREVLFKSDIVSAVSTEGCRAHLQNRYGSFFRARERFLMQLSRWPQMDDHMWIQSLATAPLSSLSSVELQDSSLTVLDVDIAGQEGTLLASLVASKGWLSLRPLLVYIVDRLLGFYLTPPTSGRVLTVAEAQQLGILDYFSDLLEEKDITDWLTFNVTLSSQVSSTLQNVIPRRKSLLASTPLTRSTSELSPAQQNELEYRLLSWLTGSPQSTSEVDKEAVVGGHVIRAHNHHAFTEELPYTAASFFSLCLFPRHIVEHIRVATLKEGCSLSSQVRRVLEVDSLFAMNNGHILSHHTVQRMLDFVNLTSYHLMKVITRCEDLFGADVILYDSKLQV